MAPGASVVVLMVRGVVTTSSTEPVVSHGSIRPGTKLTLSPGSSCILLAEGDQPVSLTGPGEYVAPGVPTDTEKSQTPSALTTLMSRFAALSSSEGSAESPAGLERGDKLMLRYPRSSIADLAPLFEWDAADPAARYELVVRALDGTAVVREQVGGSSYRCSPGRLVAGKSYTWEVRELGQGSSRSEGTAYFELLGESERSALEARTNALRSRLPADLPVTTALFLEAACLEAGGARGSAWRVYRESGDRARSSGDQRLERLCRAAQLALETLDE